MCGWWADLSTADIKKHCPWYFPLKDLISECPNVIPVGLGNNTQIYDTSLLSGHNVNRPTARPSETVDPSNNKGLGDAKEKGAEDHVAPVNLSSPGAETAVGGGQTKKAIGTDLSVTIKKENVILAKRGVRSQVDRIADTKIAQLKCKKIKLKTEQQCLKASENVASVKMREKAHWDVEIRKSEMELQKEKMHMDQEYRLGMPKHGHIVEPFSSFYLY